jgi:hypothetical protein
LCALWSHYLLLVAVEEAFKNLKGDLAIRPVFHQLEARVEAHVFIAFLAYCLHVTLGRRLHALAPGLTPRSVLEKFAAVQMIDVHLPTADGRELLLTRYTGSKTLPFGPCRTTSVTSAGGVAHASQRPIVVTSVFLTDFRTPSLSGINLLGEARISENDRGPDLGQQAGGARMSSEADVALGTEAGPDGRRIGRDSRKMGPDELRALGHAPMAPSAAIRAHCLYCCGGS